MSTSQTSETFLVVQIETPEAIEHVDEIAGTPGVDGLFIGPGDLGLRAAPRESGGRHGRLRSLRVRSRRAASKSVGVAGLLAGTDGAIRGQWGPVAESRW